MVTKNAKFDGSALFHTDLSNSKDLLNIVGRLFGDASVTIPQAAGMIDKGWPIHWPKDTLEPKDFETQWRAWQASIGYTPPS